MATIEIEDEDTDQNKNCLSTFSSPGLTLLNPLNCGTFSNNDNGVSEIRSSKPEEAPMQECMKNLVQVSSENSKLTEACTETAFVQQKESSKTTD